MDNLDFVKSIPDNTEKNDSGFGTLFTSADVRLMNPDGTLNVKIQGMNRWKKINIYKQLVKLRAWKFYLALSVIYIFLNVLFAFFYFFAQDGLSSASGEVSFLDAFFFSTQTFTTVGYGHISPNSLTANIISSSEAFVGLLYFAIATGLVYGRFSNSKADIRFSTKLLFGKFDDQNRMMLRLANVSSTELSDLNAEVIMSWIEMTNGLPLRRYRKLELELNRINLLTTTWTIVHRINDFSPCKIMYGDKKYAGLEFMVFISAFDEVFDQKVKIRTSYIEKDMVFDSRFVPITTYGGNNAVVNLDLLSSYEKITG